MEIAPSVPERSKSSRRRKNGRVKDNFPIYNLDTDLVSVGFTMVVNLTAIKRYE